MKEGIIKILRTLFYLLIIVVAGWFIGVEDVGAQVCSATRTVNQWECQFSQWPSSDCEGGICSAETCRIFNSNGVPCTTDGTCVTKYSFKDCGDDGLVNNGKCALIGTEKTFGCWVNDGGGGTGDCRTCKCEQVCSKANSKGGSSCPKTNCVGIMCKEKCGGGGGGSTCTTSRPDAPSLSSPTNGSTINSLTATLIWNGISSWGTGCPSNSDTYRVIVEANNPDPTAQQGSVERGTTTVDYIGSPGTLYYWKIRSDNGSRNRDSAIWSFFTSTSIQGVVYYDSNNTCSTSNPSNLGGSSVSERVTGLSSSVAADGTYSISDIPVAVGAYILDLNYDTANYVCSTGTGPGGGGCGAGCPTKTSVTASSTGNDFYLTTKKASWWQTSGAGVYAGSLAGGTTIQSLIPDTISASSRYLVLGDCSDCDAAVVRGSGSVALGDGSVSSAGYTVESLYRGRVLGFTFWKGQMGVGVSPVDDFISSTIEKPIADSRDFFYQDTSAIISNSWDVVAGESYVVFVDGDLDVEANVTVENGGFLAFIVSGDVTVNPVVTQLQGIYIIDGNFITESQYVADLDDDVQLSVEGTIIAWGSVTLQRDLGIGNINDPGELFTYRPDFIINMPEKMKNFILRWREVAPGTVAN